MSSECKIIRHNLFESILDGIISILMAWIIISMFAEWFFAYYIMSTQHERDVGEITFDHNHESLTDPIEKG